MPILKNLHLFMFIFKSPSCCLLLWKYVSFQLSRVQKRNRSTPSTRANRTVKGKAKGCREPHTSTFSQSYKQEFSGYAANIESKEEPNASNWISEDCETDAQELTQSTNKNRTSQESFEKFQKELDWIGLEKESLAKENMLLTALKEAEMTSISAAEQVARLWNSVAELMQVNQLPASGFSGFTEENNMFLEKLENFKIATQKLQYLLREQWNSEPCMDCTNSQVEVLTQKLTRCETENIHLKRRLQDVEKNAKEALELCQMEKVNFCFVKQLSKSVEATQARLQGQLGNKEVRNNRMSRQIMKFEGTVTGQKLQITHLKSQLAALEEQLAVDKEILKRATRAQRKRAERFETAVEDLNSQVKEKDLKLLEVRRDIDSWKKQYDLAFDERTQLETEKISLSHRVAGLEEQLQRDTERSRSTSHELLDKLHNSNLEISNLKLENVQLKAMVTGMEENVSVTTAELEQLKAKAAQQKEIVIHYETQADDQNFKLKSPSEIVESLSEEKQKLQMTIEVLSWKLKEGNLHNEELTKTIAQQEEAFLRSKSQLEERTRESSALSQQLEAALHDVTEKVRKVKDQTETQEHALQSKLHSLGLELNRKTKELKQLQWNENNAERSHETHLQELRLSLEQSENENQSIQNYMRFLKLCYTIMFGDDTITDFNGEPALR
ncbi:protein BCAP-like isoform X2 [Stegostoma tigrinum]|uniref:protein BCAP-like isoform X2 n=1 Tax=Stegostoma tigrinum TaxID=3053191 RepID=UPI002870291A|nr:protein BCAP-like isoform X2 [Stegostoma tigrinum]XP_059504097.1 protein BCAP-like isoform X2 [Stegostoma tigrinum]